MELIIYLITLIYGIVIGSFLNVLIYRIPLKEEFVKTRSHCMNCGYQLEWYDLVPLFSYMFLGGKCRKCKQKISIQYPLIEGLNGIMWLLIVMLKGWTIDSLLFCLLFSALIVLSMIDFKTYEIPLGVNVFILALGVVHLILNYTNWLEYLIGFLCVSGFLYIVYIATKGRGIGGGDIKLMAVAGLLIGWKLIIFAFAVGCIVGSVIHIIRMKVSGEGKVLAMGPYLSIGIAIAILWGEKFIEWYMGMYL